jgi:Zn-dependent M28 family amino/carboxypeptidase
VPSRWYAPLTIVDFIHNFEIAWVLGAADPVSGTVSLREMIKGFGVLMRRGWRPLRTIVFASWDAEEVNFLLYCLCYVLTKHS